MRLMEKLISTSVLASAASFIAPLAWAQDNAADAQNSGDIIVTARRQEESLQRVPIAVSVIDNKVLASGTISSVRDVQFLSPSLNVSTNNSRSADNYTLRGQGTTFGADPSVVAYFAEVPDPTGGGGGGFLFDLANIQVLNGPQGTLFGRNTTGGAILFQPRRPTNDFEGYVQVGYGNYNNFQQEAVINVPLVNDVLMVRAGISHREREGFTKDVFTGEDYDNINYLSGRVSILFKPTSNFENYTIVNFMDRKENGIGASIDSINFNSFFGTFINRNLANQVLAQQAAWGPRRVAHNSEQAEDLKALMLVNTSTLHLTPDVQLKNIFSFTRVRTRTYYDVDGSPIAAIDYFPTGYPSGVGKGGPAYNQITEELQLSGRALDGNLDWAVGAYYQRNSPKANLTKQWTFGGLNPYLPPMIPPFKAVLFQQGDQLTSKAAYVQATLDMAALSESLSGLKLTGGLRRTHDRRKDYANRYFAVGDSLTTGGACQFAPGKSFPNCRFDFPVRHFKETTYTASLSYQVTPSTMVYATARNGFKSGGFNLAAPPNAFASSFAPEFVDDIELGVKTRTTIGELPFSGSIALFHDKYKDIQRVFLRNFGTGQGTYILNAPDATIKGIETQADLNVTPEIRLGARYSYLHTKYGTFIDAETKNNFSGYPLPYSPKHKLTLTANYDRDMGEAGELGLNATYSIQSSYRNLDAFDPDIVIKGYSLLSLSAGWKNIYGSNIDLDIFATNVLNKLYRIGGGNYYYSIGFSTSMYGEPRMVGAKLTYHFGN